MIDKHMYPKNFFFDVTKDGTDGRCSLLIEGSHRRRRSSTIIQSRNLHTAPRAPEDPQAEQNLESPSQGDVPRRRQSQQNAPGADITRLTEAMSALHFVPSSIRFGRGRAGFARR